MGIGASAKSINHAIPSSTKRGTEYDTVIFFIVPERMRSTNSLATNKRSGPLPRKRRRRIIGFSRSLRDVTLTSKSSTSRELAMAPSAPAPTKPPRSGRKAWSR